MKKVIISLLASIGLSYGATVTVSPGSPAAEFKVSGGSVITNAANYKILVGFFTDYTHGTSDLAGSAFRTGLGNASTTARTALSSFVPLGGGNANLGPNGFTWNISALTGTNAGKFSVNQSLNNAALVFAGTSASNVENRVSPDGLVRGTRLFVLAYDSNSENYNEAGVFSADTWRIPGGVGMTASTSTSITLVLSQVDTALEVFRGSLGSLVLAPVVPEPTTGVMALLAGLGLISRRRRA
jgi:hypothetical protein